MRSSDRNRYRMEAYLDNSATTPVSDAVLEIVAKTLKEDFGNIVNYKK